MPRPPAPDHYHVLMLTNFLQTHGTPEHQWTLRLLVARALARCLCPDCQIEMTPEYGWLTPEATGPRRVSWVCPQCRIERMWPDPEGA